MTDTTTHSRLTHEEVAIAANAAAHHLAACVNLSTGRLRYMYGIPRGGAATLYPVAAAMRAIFGTSHTPQAMVSRLDPTIHTPENTLIVDDVADSGRTLAPYLDAGYHCLVLYASKRCAEIPTLYYGRDLTEYVVFPWEGEETGPEDAVRRILQYIGRDPDDPHVRETPRRMLSWLAEFDQRREPEFVTTAFDGFEYDGMVVVRGIPFTSLCEHHLLPFAGEAVVAYIPRDGRVLGLSKLARIVQHYARRATVQERLTSEVAEALAEATGSGDVGVLLSANHMCMSFRGPRVPTHETITSKLLGAFMRKRTRAEFMALAQR